MIGDPTEGALVVLARKGGVEVTVDHAAILHEIPFDSDRKMMSVVVRESMDGAVMYTKGCRTQSSASALPSFVTARSSR